MDWPTAGLVNLVCEAFSVLPDVAARAIETDTGLLWEVLDVRAFISAWQARALYESQDPRPDREPDISRKMGDRLTTARATRLLAQKKQRDG